MKKFIPYLHYIAGFFAIGIAVFLLMDRIVMPMYVKHGQQVSLPDVRRMDIEDATETLEASGFSPVQGDFQYNSEFEPGMIIEQQPDPGSVVKTGRRVYLTVAREESFIEMPELVGQSIRGAQLTLNRVGLRVDSIEWVYSDTFPEDVVIWQSVGSRGLIRRGSGVLLRVSQGNNPNRFTVPNLVDMSLDDAREEIAESRLEMGQIQYVQDTELIPYTVLEQSVPPGTTLQEPVSIDLTVSVMSLNDILNQQQRQQ